MAGKGTVDALLISTRIVTSHAIETNTPLFKCYVDLTKAYDKVNRETMWEILCRLGAPANLVNLIASLHDGAMASVKTAGCYKGSAFELRTGLKAAGVCPIPYAVQHFPWGFRERHTCPIRPKCTRYSSGGLWGVC